MPKNVEIKARVHDMEFLLQKATELADTGPLTFHQLDTFFNVPNGRLKLRKQEGRSLQLIYYKRLDTEGPKLSEFEICCFPEGSNLFGVLNPALGVKGTVSKMRTWCMIDTTRVHIDTVDELGEYMELEVVLGDKLTVEQGQEIAKDLMEKLGIREKDLVYGSYLDLILHLHKHEIKTK